MTFADRINPRKFNFSPKMTALVGAIIGHDYGIKDNRGNTLRSISISSDGFVMGNGSSAFIGTASDMDANLLQFTTFCLKRADRKRFASLYKERVIDWRTL